MASWVVVTEAGGVATKELPTPVPGELSRAGPDGGAGGELPCRGVRERERRL